MNITGCRKPVSFVDPPAERPFQGISLRIATTDAIRNTELLTSFAKDWSNRTGANVEVLPGTWDGKTPADLVIMAPAELPHWAQTDQLSELPSTIRPSSFKYQWSDLPGVYADKLVRWQGKVFGLPILGEGQLLVYRSDLFQEHLQRVPETWEDLLEVARFFQKKRQDPPLISLSKDPRSLEEELYRIAANYDRAAITESNLGRGPTNAAEEDRFFSFHFRISNGEPRVNTPAFVHALQLMQQMQSLRPTKVSDDPALDFRSGKAVFGVVSLEDLARFQEVDSPVRGKIGIALIPGSKWIFDPGTGQKKEIQPVGTVNRVPYIGARGWVGGITKTSTATDACIDFLAEIAHPVTSSLEIIGAGKWGAGPFRVSHLDSRNRSNWFGYGFGVEQTDRLVEILRFNLAPSIVNYCVCLRIPEERSCRRVMVDTIRQALFLDGDAKKLLDQTVEEWKKFKLDPNSYRMSLGL